MARVHHGGVVLYPRGVNRIWIARWSEKNARGKYVTKRKSTGTSDEVEAEGIAATFTSERRARQDPNHAVKSSSTLVEAVNFFLGEIKAEGLPKATQTMYRQKSDRLLGKWKAGGTRVALPALLAGLDADVVARFFDGRKEALLARNPERRCGECDGCVEGEACERRTDSARSTCHKEWVALSRILKCAARRNRLPSHVNVAALKPSWVAPNTKPKTRYLTADDVVIFLEATPENVAAVVALIIASGMRRSEAFRFRPEDLDRKTGRLRIRGTKTDGAKREIIVPQGLRWLLDYVPDAPLDPSLKDDPRKMSAFAETAGLAPVSFNDLRRTFGSLLVQGGTPLDVVAKLMGHSSTTMVFRVYGQTTPESLAALAKVAAFPSVSKGSKKSKRSSGSNGSTKRPKSPKTSRNQHTTSDS